MDDNSSAPPRREQHFRSTASTNWRNKDDSPRVEQTQRRNQHRTYDGAQGRSHTNDNTPYSRPSNAQDATHDAIAEPSSRLYVGNLLYSAQKSDIEHLFASNGFNPTNVSMSTDPFTGRNPSYCFVDLESPDEASRAIDVLNGIDMLGRVVKVSPGVAKKGPRGEGRMKDDQGAWRRTEKREEAADYKPSFDRWNRSDAASHFTAPVAEGRRLYFGGLPRMEPHSTLEEEIQTLFSSFTSVSPTAVSKLISPHPSKSSEPGNHYYCFVDLESKDDVEDVIAALDGQQGSWGGAIRVNKAREQREGGRERKVLRDQGGDRRVVGGVNWRTE